MNPAVREMLAKYKIHNTQDVENALKEIIQEIALLGLQRANFFEKAAFYGGTSLRILYSLPRFSEDLDFTLFKPEKDFKLTPYFSSVERELAAYGFHTEIQRADKKMNTDVESAFIKANTKVHLLKIEPLQQFESVVQNNKKLQIKFEVDTDPVTSFEYEPRYLLDPISFPVISLKKPDLFAGKLHALLFRKWKNRLKGRDFYDFVWYLKNKTPVRLSYLRDKALQSGHCKKTDLQSATDLKKLLNHRFQNVDFASAKEDILPFIKDPREVSVWSADFFTQITERIEVV